MSSRSIFEGGGGGESTATLQSTYMASSPSEIITNESLRPFSIAGGTGSNADINFLIKNNAGSDTLSISADGEIIGNNIKKSNINATTSPSNTNDISEGFDISSIWVNGTTNDIYVCCDATVNLAVWKKISNDDIRLFENYQALYVNPTLGNDTTGEGSLNNPFATLQACINSFTAGSPKVIYVKGSTTDNITFRSGDKSMRIIFDPKTSHTGDITLVDGNTSIYFESISGSATLSGQINDNSKGAIYYDCVMNNVSYNKTGGSGTIVPEGYVEFKVNSNIDGMSVSLTGNSILRTLGTGSMGVLNQSNGIFNASHKGSMICPVITGGVNPLVGQPTFLLQGDIQLITDASNNSLLCDASYGIVYLAGGSTLQNDLVTYGKIDFTGSGANCFCHVWSNAQIAKNGDIFPLSGVLLPNSADYTDVNYTFVNAGTPENNSVKSAIKLIDEALIGGLTSSSSYSGSSVPSQFNVENGLVQSISTRNLTPANINAVNRGGDTMTGFLTLSSSYTTSQMLFNRGRSAFGGSGYSNVLNAYRSGNVPNIENDDDNDYFIYCASSTGSAKFRVSASGTVWNSSDERLKDNISNLDDTLDKLDNFRGVKYSLKEDKNKKVNYGVIAQELITAFPELVMQETDKEKIDDPDYAGDGYMSVDYTGLHAVAIQAIKELHLKVKVLEDEIKLIKSK